MKKNDLLINSSDKLVGELDAPFFDDASCLESSRSIDRLSVNLRKQVSVRKVVESGFKVIKINIDAALYERLKDIYDRAGYKYVDKGEENSFKTAELSAALSYFLLINSDDICFGTQFGYKAYLHSIYSIVQYRKMVVGDDYDAVCKFLNNKKYKFYTRKSYQMQQGGEWGKGNVEIFFDSDSVVDVISVLAETKKIKPHTKRVVTKL
jgi:hypothetical protein